MSFDLYLFDIPEDQTVDCAYTRLETLNARIEVGSGSSDHHRYIADTLIKHDDRYKLSECYFCDLLDDPPSNDLERQRFKYLQLDGPSTANLAQIVFHSNHIVLHCYRGTAEYEIEAYLRVICTETDYAVLDPQAGEIYRFSNH